jgi:hypothetical protein
VTDSTLGRTQRCLPLAEAPGVCGAVVPAAGSTISVDLPRMTGLVASVWDRVRGRVPTPAAP